jgi:hypothetical protein
VNGLEDYWIHPIHVNVHGRRRIHPIHVNVHGRRRIHPISVNSLEGTGEVAYAA